MFSSLLVTILPLFLLILPGWWIGRRRSEARALVADLLINFISPVVVFYALLREELTLSALLLPLLFLLMGISAAFLALVLGRRIFRDSTLNILVFAAGSGNTGYFGLPVAIALFGADAVTPVVLAIIGVILFENTLGYYYVARGNYSPRQSLARVARLPPLYAALLGIIFHLLGWADVGAVFLQDLAQKFVGAYTVLGMLLIGVGFAGAKRDALDLKFVSAACLLRFLLWPLMAYLVLALPLPFSPLERGVIVLLATVPIAANTVAYAAQLDVQPSKAAVAVLISTVLAFLAIPFWLKVFALL